MEVGFISVKGFIKVEHLKYSETIDNMLIFGGDQLDVILEQMCDGREIGEDLFSQLNDRYS
jgi:hypothetical protein